MQNQSSGSRDATDDPWRQLLSPMWTLSCYNQNATSSEGSSWIIKRWPQRWPGGVRIKEIRPKKGPTIFAFAHIAASRWGIHPVRGPAWDPTRAAWRSHSRGGFLWPQESSMVLIRKISIIGWSVRTCDLACLHMNVFLDLCARFDLAKSAKFGSKTIRVGHGWFLGTPHAWATATVIFCFKTIAHGHVPTRRNDQKKAALGVGIVWTSMDIYRLLL